MSDTSLQVILSGAKDRVKHASEARGSLAPPTRSFAPLRMTAGPLQRLSVLSVFSVLSVLSVLLFPSSGNSDHPTLIYPRLPQTG